VQLSIQHSLPLVLTTCLLGCSGGGSSDDVTDPLSFDPLADQFKPGAINIGSITNIPSVRNGVLLGVRHVNDAGGVLNKEFNVTAFVAEGAQDSVELAGKMLERDIKVINVSFSSRSLAVSELTIPAEIPLISESATSSFFTDYEDNDYYFRLVPSDVIQGRVLAQVAINAGSVRAVTVFNEGDTYGETLTSQFKTNYELAGGTVLIRVAIPFEVTTGFDSFLQLIEDQDPDLILNTILEASVAANLENESAAFDIDALSLLPDASAGVKAFLNSIANIDNVDGALGTSPGFGFALNPEMIYFTESYQQQFDTAPDGFNVNGYDFSLISALAIEHAGFVNNTDNPSGRMIRDSLRRVMNPPGVVVGPLNIAEGLQLIRDGSEVDYAGGYGANNWDDNGDITGEVTYDILRLDAASGSWITERQEQIFVTDD
jgi:branched-chain amino acid transport system substrate-binding protein